MNYIQKQDEPYFFFYLINKITAPTHTLQFISQKNRRYVLNEDVINLQNNRSGSKI